MKNITRLVFSLLCMVVLLVPSVGSIFSRPSGPIGNETAAVKPKVNLNLLSDAGTYFEKTFAFRPQAITADSRIMTGLFQTSSIGTVVAGKDDWLYYTDSVNDFLGRDPLSEAELVGAARNLKLLQEYTEQQGIQFVFTIAPNKNTLYGTHMPYYESLEASSVHNRDGFAEAIEGQGIHYVDLFTLFENEPQTLYFKQDSHWNNAGALLAYDAILSSIGKEHDDFADADVQKKKSHVGDLAKMLFPGAGEPEYDYDYGQTKRYQYVGASQSVENAMVETKCKDASGSLYMYRDSFGNSLLPFFASAYEKAVFTKAFNTDIEAALQKNEPDIFIMELVERNIDWLLTMPPLIPAPVTEGVSVDATEDRGLEVQAGASQNANRYLEVSGTFDDTEEKVYDQILLAVTGPDGKDEVFECYRSLADEGKTGFRAYLYAEDYAQMGSLHVQVIVHDANGYTEVGSADAAIIN